MTQQVENSNATKPKDEVVPATTERKQIDHIAQEMAEKASRTEQKYDEDRGVFSK